LDNRKAGTFPQTDLPIGNSISLAGLGKSQPRPAEGPLAGLSPA